MITAGRTTRLIAYLNGTGHVVDEVGGKGVGLDLLLRHDYPVPKAAVITTAAYRSVVTERSLQLLIDDLRTSALPAPDNIRAESAAIERTFLAAPLPERISEAIARLGREFLDNGRVAVRSSATTEDMAGASFAGQHLTVTGVGSIDGLERAVRRCWASLWMPAARAYRRRHRISDQQAAMAVIVQSMVEPMWSGVAFTRDPQGEDHLIRIEAVPGLGDDLVSGRVTPADYLVRRDTLEISPSDAAPELDFIEDLARLAVRIEQTAGAPQDIEWAYTESGISLLQVRPITEPVTPAGLDDGLDTVDVPKHIFTPRGVVEMLPGAVSPLLWTINAPMLEHAFRTTFADLGGSPPSKDQPLVVRFRGRAALDLSAIGAVAGSLPGGDPLEVERQYLGRTISDAPSRPPLHGVHLFAAMRGRRAHNRIVDEVDLIATAAVALARMQLDLTELPVRVLVAYRQRIRDLAWRGYTAEVGASSAAGATYRALELLLERWVDENEAASWAQRLTRGALDESPIGAARARGLEDVLARYGTADITKLLAHPADELRARVAAVGPDGRRFLTALDNTVRLMGSKSIYGDEAWSEDESWTWHQLRRLTRGEARRTTDRPRWSDDFAVLCRQLSSRKAWRRIRILTGQFVDVRMRWLRRQVEETIRFLELRERAKNALLALGGEERRILVEAGRRLVASRQLAKADLIECLTDAELERMLFGLVGISRAELERRRNIGKACAAAGPLGDWFVGHPDTAPLPEIPDGDRLSGWAASPGQTTGTARVISSLAEGVRLEPGDVLVAHATDPSWTPLFLIAGGVVLEVGGPLSHAAIVAREFGLPAVLNVPQATRALADGDRVVVDGTLGIVERTNGEGMT